MKRNLILIALVVTACGAPRGATVTAEPVAPASTLGEVAAAPPPSPEPEPPPAKPEPPKFPHSAEQTAKLQAALTAALAAPEARSLVTGLRIVDVATGDVLFRHDDERPLVPASNTKLFTTFAALRALGASGRAKMTFAISGARKSKEHVDALVVDGGGVPFGAPFATLDVAMASVVAALRKQGVRKIDRMIIASPAIVAPDRFHELDVAVHRDRTASAVRKALGKAQIAVGRLAAGSPTPAAEIVAELDGPSVAEWITPVNQLSHNGFADALSLHLGHAPGAPVSLSSGAVVIARELDRAGISGVELADGSGLSRRNHVSARAIVDLLQAARGDDAFVGSLAVGGVVGTLAGRMKDASLAGRVRAKTGSLKEVIATSGYLDHTVDGRRYAFAIVTNGVDEGGGPNVRAMHDRWLTILAADWWT